MGEVSPAAVLPADVYTAREIALAAGVAEADVVAALGASAPEFVNHADAVRLGRVLVSRRTPPRSDAPDLFARVVPASAGRRESSVGAPIALSGGIHVAGVAVAVWLTSVGLAPAAVGASTEPVRGPAVQLVFLREPGPGGGGGGGGNRDPRDPPKATRVGRSTVSSPVPRRTPPEVVSPKVTLPRPAPPLNAEPLPAVVAPVVAAGADARDRAGILERSPSAVDTRGPGTGGGAGNGTGTGLGAGAGSGIGEGSGGGIGGGPYRPGSGIEPPRLVREIKADYTEEARRRNIEGDVVLQIVVRRDGSVGTVQLTKGLGSGLDDRAVQAVRQWQFAPATRLGSPVDVMVEVAVEFRLR